MMSSRLPTILLAAVASLAALLPPAAAAPSAPPPSAAQQRYLALAIGGVHEAQRRWRDRRLGWYDARLGGRARYPLATIWGIVPLFEALDAIAIAQPTL